MKLTLGEIADRFQLPVKGDPSIEIDGIANLLDAVPGQLAFLFSSSYKRHLPKTAASAVVLQEVDSLDCTIPCLITEQPRLCWARIASLFDPSPPADGMRHASAVVSSDADIGSNVSIGAHAVIEAGASVGADSIIGAGSIVGAHVTLGENCRLYPNSTLYHGVVVGRNAIVHSGAVIGADGFGFEFDAANGVLVKIPQVYTVVVGDDVEIGAGTTVDRGALNDTRIGNGVKLDNQVQVGHGTRIGAHTAVSGCTAIAGSTTIGSFCLIGGAVGIIDNISIVDRVEITAMSMVSQSITVPGRYSSGTGLMPGNEWKRNIVGFKQLANLLRRVRKLEAGYRDS